MPFLAFALSNWRLLAIAGGVAALIGSGLYLRSSLIAQGERAALEQVDEANAKARAKADAASEAVSLCGARGGLWNRADGVCEPAAGQ